MHSIKFAKEIQELEAAQSNPDNAAATWCEACVKLACLRFNVSIYKIRLQMRMRRFRKLPPSLPLDFNRHPNS